MIKLSTENLTLLVFVFLSVIAMPVLALDWPVKREIDLSSGFGDFRQNHFHAGVDIRTGGRVGEKVYSPVDGYVWRVIMSYNGYGKGLYIKGSDNHFYIFGHLLDFIDKIEKPVRDEQISEREYYQDIYFEEDKIPVKKGELLGYTGQSGKGGPHLHFERRTPDNKPLNPLKHGLKLKDKIRPVFKKIGFQLTDDHSLFGNGERKIFFDVTYGEKVGQYRLDTTLYFQSPFGVLSGCFDLIRTSGVKLTVYKLEVYFDDVLYYRVEFDTVNYKTTRSVNLEYDFLSIIEDDNKYRRLFEKNGNEYTGSGGLENKRGIFGLSDESLGKHQGRIVAEDCSGNKSELVFDFLWGPPGNIIELDTIISNYYGFATAYFTPIAEYSDYDIDSMKVYYNWQEDWEPIDSIFTTFLEDGRIKCDLYMKNVINKPLQIYLYNNRGALIKDNVFHGVMNLGKKRVKLEHEIIEDGLLVTLNAQQKKASRSRIELYYKDTLLGIEYPRMYNMNKFICFVAPQEKYRRIDRIGYLLSENTTLEAMMNDSVNIFLVGAGENEEITFTDRFKITLMESNFYQPRFVEVKENFVINPGLLKMNSAHYQIFPESFVCREDFDITINLKVPNQTNKYCGICWLDKEENAWVWMKDNKYNHDTLTAKAAGGGSIAAIFDYEPPMIFNLNVNANRNFKKERFDIRFKTDDTLSGIPENGITVKLDGKWLPADYDPDSFECVVKPGCTLKPGEHHVGIIVVDRAGNVNEIYRKFQVI